MGSRNAANDASVDFVQSHASHSHDSVPRDEQPRLSVATTAPGSGCMQLARPAVDLEIIIPVLNEERRLPRTLARTVAFLERRRWVSSVVVVDNGSVDHTVDLARSCSSPTVPVYVLGCSVRGKGAAVRRGIQTSQARYLGFTDADLATPIENLDAAMSLLQQGAAAVVASRRAPFAGYAGTQSAARRAGGAFFRLCFRAVVPQVADTQCGFKFFAGDLARRLTAECMVDGFIFDVELLARVQDAQYEVREIPVIWTDGPGSTFRVVRDGLGSLLEVSRLLRAVGPRLGARP